MWKFEILGEKPVQVPLILLLTLQGHFEDISRAFKVKGRLLAA
jgi:hypothetical protein